MASKIMQQCPLPGKYSPRRSRSQKPKNIEYLPNVKSNTKAGSEESQPANELKSQQTKEKKQKDSVPMLHQETSNGHLPFEGFRRVTRGSNSRGNSELDLPIEIATPENQQTSLGQEEDTCLKIQKQPSVPRVLENIRSDATLNGKRGSIKSLDIFSPYGERKSYRKAHKKELSSIPFRKCHDQFQGRIVNILNKIISDKNCHKDFQGLLDKMQKISTKELLNRYIVSGILTIIRLASEKDLYDPQIVHKLREEFENVKLKVIEELGKDDIYDCASPVQTQEEVDTQKYRNQIAKKIYKILRRQRPFESHIVLREECLKMCEEFFCSEISLERTVRFLKEAEQGSRV